MKQNRNKLAKKYNVSQKTISRWRTQGAPLGDYKLMRAWLAERKHLPPGLTAHGDSAKAVVVPVRPEHPGTDALGAGGALARLERRELELSQKLDALVASGGDPLEIKAADGAWLRTAKMLREFERDIAEHKRTMGSLVERAQVEKALRLLGMIMRTASEEKLPQLIDALQGEADVIKARGVLRRAGYCTAVIGHSMLKALNVPEWMTAALASDLCAATNTSEAELASKAKFLAEQLGKIDGRAQLAGEGYQPK